MALEGKHCQHPRQQKGALVHAWSMRANRHDAEELMQDAFLKLWERWGEIYRIDDPSAYLFRVALNGFRMRRRRAAMAIRKVIPIPENRDVRIAPISSHGSVLAINEGGPILGA
jgi:DNA-directed RNA polymerase specialized sigma24 family protein